MNLVMRFIFLKKIFLKNNRYWDWNKVKYITTDNKIELLDIDTEEDFLIVGMEKSQ